MNSRERVEMALNHQEADRVPCDLGGTVMSSLNVVAYRNLRAHLGLPEVNIRVADTVQQLVYVDDDVRDQFGVDVRGINPGSSAATSRIVIQEDQPNYRYFTDEWGIGWRMPKDGGLYFDVCRHPLRGDLTPTDLDRYPWPDPVDPARFVGMREQVRKAVEEEGRAVIIGGLCAGFVEMAGWMRGYEDYLIDFAANTDFLEAFFDKILELKMAYWERMLAEVGDLISAVLESDDMGSQTDLLFSPRMYRKYVKPRHTQLYSFIKSKTRGKVFLHSCGAIRKVLPDLIEAGVDILNPVQVSAAGMDSAELKRDFGKDLTFWGGGVDTQRILGGGTVQEVRDEVHRRIDDLAPGGGFIFATVHAVQGNVPPANVLAVWDALREFGHYPIKK
ncbi:MAG TPA: uroporphyrinogen decarboxylase family protein [Anaerolineaceae bacterium]|jgi:uroporphyrinogen decarboxylase